MNIATPRYQAVLLHSGRYADPPPRSPASAATSRGMPACAGSAFGLAFLTKEMTTSGDRAVGLCVFWDVAPRRIWRPRAIAIAWYGGYLASSIAVRVGFLYADKDRGSGDLPGRSRKPGSPNRAEVLCRVSSQVDSLGPAMCSSAPALSRSRSWPPFSGPLARLVWPGPSAVSAEVQHSFGRSEEHSTNVVIPARSPDGTCAAAACHHLERRVPAPAVSR